MKKKYNIFFFISDEGYGHTVRQRAIIKEFIKNKKVESITVYKQLGKGAFTSVMLDWRGAYPHAEAYLTPFLSCKKSNGSFCSEGESAASGSFWTNNQIKRILQLSDRTLGEARNGLLNSAEKGAANGASYLPVWLVTPRAWAQNELEKPEFDTNGHLKLGRLRAVEDD